jgi:hypothetical protein
MRALSLLMRLMKKRPFFPTFARILGNEGGVS